MAVALVRTLILYIIIILCIKIMGKRQISDFQTSELVVTFLISDIASIPMQNTDQPLFSGLIPIITLMCCEVFISYGMMKSPRLKKFICGNSVILIDNGKLDQKKLKNLRMTVDDLFEQLHGMNIFSLQDVAFAIVETNGKLSVLKKTAQQPPSASTLGIEVPNDTLETVIVNDGKISNFSLSLCGLNKEWLNGVLQGKGIKIEDIFIMTANKNKDFNIIKREVN